MTPTLLNLDQIAKLVTGSFNGILSAAEDTIQKAFDKLDDHQHLQSDVWGGNALSVAVPASLTYYLCPLTTVLASSTFGMKYPRAGTLKNFTIQVNGIQPAGGSLVMTVQVNDAPTTITVTCPSGSGNTSFTDNTHAAAINAGDKINIKVQNNAAAPSTLVGGWSLEIEYATH